MPAAGMAEVVFKYKDDALEAYKKYNQRNLDGQPMMCRVHPTSRSRLSGYGHRYAYINTLVRNSPKACKTSRSYIIIYTKLSIIIILQLPIKVR